MTLSDHLSSWIARGFQSNGLVTVWFLIAFLVLLVIAILNQTSEEHTSTSTKRSERNLHSCFFNCLSSISPQWNPFTKMVTRLTLAIILAFIVFAIFLSSFFRAINTDNDINNQFVLNDSVMFNDKLTIDNKYENLVWFIHISDTHLNHYLDKGRKADLLDFCRDVIPFVHPSLLLLSGDITDSRSRDPMGSGQHHQEWLMYQEVRDKCLAHNPSLPWIDIKGNHDNFNVYKSTNNYHKNYTVQGNLTKDGWSYRYELKAKDGLRYSFIAADACLKPGLRRPFNFVGRFDQEELNKINRLKQESASSNYTIWFGHYPTSSIANNEDFRPLVNGPYLCGHYHTINGLVKSMISTQPQGFLEAEIADWKDNRVFRIAAVDHGLFTFSDYYYHLHRELPLIVITNPRSVLHQMEHLEPYWRTASSTHLRVLVFTKRTSLEVKAFISSEARFDHSNVIESFELEHIEGPLWSARWTPAKYEKGLYYITVIATDDHYTNQLTSPFSLDRTKPNYTILGRLTLRVDFKIIGICVFVCCFLFSTIPLIALKISTSDLRYMLSMSRRSYFRKNIFKLFLLAHVGKIFYPVLLVPFYILIGPWFIGHFVLDHIGVAFIWGQFVDGQYLPVGFTFIFAAIFMSSLHIPFVVCLSSLIYSRYIKVLRKSQPVVLVNEDNRENNSLYKEHFVLFPCDFMSLNIVFLCVICIMQALVSSLFYFAYGYLAIITNFFTWTSVIYFILTLVVLRLEISDFKNSAVQDYRPIDQTNEQSANTSSK